MSELIVNQDIRLLIDQWMEAEQNGEQFPVDFDIAWQIAGYSTKQKGQNKLKYLEEGKDFLTDRLKTSTGGRPGKLIKMSCDALKHFCLLAETNEGRQIRQYFIESEKKWQLTKKLAPDIAQKIEYQHLINEGLRLEAQKISSELALLQFRKLVTDIAPEIIQQKILGYTEIKHIEYRDRLIKDEEMINDGSTVTKTELCRRYGLTTPKGKPDYKRLNYLIDDAGLNDDPEYWDEAFSIRQDKQLKREAVPVLDDYYKSSPRQPYLIE